MATSAEVLDHGRDREPRHRFAGAGITVLIAGGLVVAAVAGATTWWTSRPPTSDRLEIVGASVLTRTPVTVVAEPPIGALATPAGATLPGITVRLRVGGDPGKDTQVSTSPTDAIVYVQEQAPITIAAGSFIEVDVTIAPVDCSLAREGTDLDEAGYRWRRAFGVEILATAEGTAVSTADPAQGELRDALAQACAQAGPMPELTVTAARRGGETPLETIGLVVDVDGTADRYVLTPLDGPGLRGLGAADRRSGDGIPLLWLISPRAEHNDDVTTAYTQVFMVREGTAYPWIIGTAITDDLPEMTPLTTSIR
ncbi:MAG: hypothetical protein ACO3ID_05185 [Candidatus Nanopelagicales bacterium]|jgi:hypothetical protein